MKTIGVIYGGKSVEHDISVITALQMMRILRRNYKIFPIYIDQDGCWWTGKNLEKVSIYRDFKNLCKGKKRVFCAFKEGFFRGKKKVLVDACELCCHGLNGEDGSVAGVLELCNIPYTSSGISSSAIGMDKALTKIVLKHFGIETSQFICVCRESFEKEENLEKVVSELEFPLIVKPANLGSSVGINVVRNVVDLKDAIEVALNFDDKVVIEKFFEGAREFNCACFRYKGKEYVSNVTEVFRGEIFTFEEKYLQDRPEKKEKIDLELKKQIQDLTKKTYKKLECFGVVRVDFLFFENKLYVNEINTIPGAMACYLFEENFEEVLDLVLEEARLRVERKGQINYSFKSDALKLFEQEEKEISFKK